MKKIFVCEFITSGGMRDRELPAGLLADAELMVQALLRDLRQIPFLDVIVCRDDRLSAVAETLVLVGPGDDVWSQWQRCIQFADMTWIIAPETDGVLLQMTRFVGQCRGILIGCSETAVALTTSKSATYEYLRAHKIRVPPEDSINGASPLRYSAWVMKPDDGAGGVECYFFANAVEYMKWENINTGKPGFILQPYISGESISLSVVYAGEKSILLSCNRHLVSHEEGRIINRGISINAVLHQRVLLEELARDIGRAIPGLRGYVGIDLILGDGGPCVLDINPRLTTSYAGLSAVLNRNVAELIISLLQDDTVQFLSERRNMFAPEGAD